METRLTLKMDKSIIERAKNYAKSNHLSISDLIANYLMTITQVPKADTNTFQSPIVDSLAGIIHLPEDYDYKKEYSNYLIDKHK